MADDPEERRESPSQQPHIYRPVPRRTFEPKVLRDQADSPTHAFSHQPHSPSNLQNSRSSDFLAQLNARLLRTYQSRNDDSPESPIDGSGSARLPRQNKSFLNMNSSTLFGIYDDVGTEAQSVAETPWGTGAETPGHTGMGWPGNAYETGTGGADAGLSMKSAARRASGKSKLQTEIRRSSQTRKARSGVAKYAVLFFKLAALFTFGVLYGLIVSHLHDTRQLAAVHVKGVDRESWFYVTTWGCAGVALGSLLPYIDLLWSRHSTLDKAEEKEQAEKDGESPISEQINDVVRSVAAFVGVAFAIVSSTNLYRTTCMYANATIAPSSLAVDPAAHPHPRACQSCPLVHTRPQQARPVVFAHRHFNPYLAHVPLEPYRFAITICTSRHKCHACTLDTQS